ncbi:CPBP family intramembrane glutamic endopeptidase [Nonomuraea wenchangensis]|uniref:Membrane protease YdiL, CAAX protease family n=1 Tax=Nonomuraea wenchangensis TaxID=568860 RepID=A0A1I0JW80_9ACTN|nr:type II CAAX endopeptidase family protein [Nonomuraea wenchangensis]SEU15234.1 Membrane protease YdiL, CAAX protease family [Nonomuraea wenchangensis]
MRRATHPVWAVLITLAATFGQIIVGTAPVTLLLDSGHPLYRPLGMIGITLASLGLVHLIRRFLGGQSWAGVGLERSRRAVPQLFLGVVAGAVPVAAAIMLSVAFGAMSLPPGDKIFADAGLLPYGIAFALLSQAFPEELLWRGHLFDTLSARLPPKAVLIVVSVGFGALHIISSSAADSLGERLLYVLQAVALGFACAAARAHTGTLWMAVGVHTGLHTANLLLPAEAVHYGVHLVILSCALTVSGLLLLRSGRGEKARTQPTPK